MGAVAPLPIRRIDIGYRDLPLILTQLYSRILFRKFEFSAVVDDSVQNPSIRLSRSKSVALRTSRPDIQAATYFESLFGGSDAYLL